MRKPVKTPALAFIPPMLPTLVDEPPEGDDWIHEIKYDGWRTQVVVDRGSARVFTRNGHDWTLKFAPVAAAALRLGHDGLIIDGEMTLDGPEGKPDYQALRKLVKTNPQPGASSRSTSCTSTITTSATWRSRNAGIFSRMW